VDSFVTVLVICLISGLAFLLGSLLVVSKLPRSQDTSGNSTIKWRDLTVSTSNVFVALTFVSAALAVAIPSYAMWLNSRIDEQPITLRAQLPHAAGGTYSFAYDGDSDVSGGTYSFPLFKSEVRQGFAVTNKASANKAYHSVSAYYAWLDKAVHVTVDNVEVAAKPANDGYLDVPLDFGSAPIKPASTIPITPGPQPSIPQNADAIANPPGATSS
jgi:hypothetical protein